MSFIFSAVILVLASTTALRLFYMYSGYHSDGQRKDGPEQLPIHALPLYTVLVALYKEADVVPALLASLARLQYPDDRLQVVLLCEEDDPETARVCAANLRPGWELVVVPDGVPRTKPRALNAGLPRVTGEFFTIYDAEDRPEPDQLVKAVNQFRQLSPLVASLQARLDFYNSGQTLITRWFTCDYAGHFGLFLRGLASRGHPVPLGGTSTHFRTQLVRDVGGWDSWNVTEDCELGMRLAAAGLETGMLDSVTWEEAVPRTRAWIRQRSRWVKGYAQTGLVMLRAPLRTASAMGWRRYLAALGVVAGLPVGLCTQIVSWALLDLYIVLRVWGKDVSWIEAWFPEPLLSLGIGTLLFGNFALMVAHVGEMHREGRYHLIPSALAIPLYWLLASIAAWKGVGQLVRRPHFWEKTQHGVSEQARAGPAPRRSSVT
ncbi:MAG: glycosyltransferase family 2 protein [Acidimicrobiales bacterium]